MKPLKLSLQFIDSMLASELAIKTREAKNFRRGSPTLHDPPGTRTELAEASYNEPARCGCGWRQQCTQ